MPAQFFQGRFPLCQSQDICKMFPMCDGPVRRCRWNPSFGLIRILGNLLICYPFMPGKDACILRAH